MDQWIDDLKASGGSECDMCVGNNASVHDFAGHVDNIWLLRLNWY